jgi:hypothetical protein
MHAIELTWIESFLQMGGALAAAENKFSAGASTQNGRGKQR